MVVNWNILPVYVDSFLNRLSFFVLFSQTTKAYISMSEISQNQFKVARIWNVSFSQHTATAIWRGEKTFCSLASLNFYSLDVAVRLSVWILVESRARSSGSTCKQSVLEVVNYADEWSGRRRTARADFRKAKLCESKLFFWSTFDSSPVARGRARIQTRHFTFKSRDIRLTLKPEKKNSI